MIYRKNKQTTTNRLLVPAMRQTHTQCGRIKRFWLRFASSKQWYDSTTYEPTKKS